MSRRDLGQEKKKKRGKPATGSLETFSRQNERMECRECGGEDSGIIHGLHHGDVQLQIIGGGVWGVHPGLVRGNCEGTRDVSCEVVESVVTKASGEGGFEGRQRAALLGDAGNDYGVS